jgi:hypothetical protein
MRLEDTVRVKVERIDELNSMVTVRQQAVAHSADAQA